MNQYELSELPGVPTWLGLPMYPGGLPMQKDSIIYNGKTLEKIYQDRVNDICTRKVPPNFDEEAILKNYAIYHIHAPIFQSEFTEELIESDFSELSLDSLIMKCLEYGLDPL